MGAFRRVVRTGLWPAFLPFLLLLSGCVNGRALLLFEQPYWASLGEQTPLQVSLAARALSRGYIPRVVVFTPADAPGPAPA